MISDRRTEKWTRDAVRPLGDAPPINRTDIARLRRALAAGTYRVDPDAVATAMIATDLPPVTEQD